MVVVEPRVEEEKVLYEWVGWARPHKQFNLGKSRRPLIILILVAVVLMVAMEWMMILLLAALVFAYYAWIMVPPDKINYKITTKGIRVEDRLYVWEGMGRWWTEEQWGSQMIVVESAEAMMGRLFLPLEAEQLSKAAEVMSLMLVQDRPKPDKMAAAGEWLKKKMPGLG